MVKENRTARRAQAFGKQWTIESSLLVLVLGSCWTVCGVSRAKADAPEDQRRTGRVLDTSANPFIVTGDGKELGDPFPVYWDLPTAARGGYAVFVVYSR